MTSTTDNAWKDTCEHCGGDLPLDAPGYQKYCSAECRNAAYEVYQVQDREAWNAERRQMRADAKRDRPPCPECGTVLPVTMFSNAVFCCDLCQRKNYNRRRAAKMRDARLSARAAQRAARSAAASE